MPKTIPGTRNVPRRPRRALRCTHLQIGAAGRANAGVDRLVLTCTNPELAGDAPLIVRPAICRLCTSWDGPKGKKKQ